MHLSIRELEIKDIPLITDYWLLSDKDFLISMGVALDKIPSRENFTKMLTKQLSLPIKERQTYALIWEIDGNAVGHTNVNEIVENKQAKMHLHLWNATNRKKGVGVKLVQKSLPIFFDKLNLEKIICEPYAENPAPNKVLEKIGFTFIKSHVTIPGSINFEQKVNTWEICKNEL
ncbi:GNAT family N-acetyltransferase [Aureivirga marina]|uniref:GNAT family N-acetyltransferase n=1 Tax=Aureivirga marina TaxID=1182451 RepID=UPI0018CB2E48|nr:GNAT family protein [Aureivirga marina]